MRIIHLIVNGVSKILIFDHRWWDGVLLTYKNRGLKIERKRSGHIKAGERIQRKNSYMVLKTSLFC